MKVKNKTATPSGFRDYETSDVIARENLISKIREVYEVYGFDPLDTPTIEYAETLLPNRDSEDAKVFFQAQRFRGSKEVGSEEVADLGLRFDLTVPLARYVASKQGILPQPFKRYQVGKVFRGERPQKGRFCEFFQFDIDTVGVKDLFADAEIIAGIYESLVSIGLKDKFVLRINNRKILNGLPSFACFEEEKLVEVIRIIDKLEKIGIVKVVESLRGLGLEEFSIRKLEEFISLEGDVESLLGELGEASDNSDIKEGLAELKEVISYLDVLGVSRSSYKIDYSIARGLDYYTGTIFETTLLELPSIGSICSGGRYDNLVDRFSSNNVPCVGASIGIDRLLEALKEIGLISRRETTTSVLVTQFDPERKLDYLEILAELRSSGIKANLYLGEDSSFRGQLTFAIKRSIPFVVICGEREFKSNTISVKNIVSRKQETIPRGELVSFLKDQI